MEMLGKHGGGGRRNVAIAMRRKRKKKKFCYHGQKCNNSQKKIMCVHPSLSATGQFPITVLLLLPAPPSIASSSSRWRGGGGSVSFLLPPRAPANSAESSEKKTPEKKAVGSVGDQIYDMRVNHSLPTNHSPLPLSPLLWPSDNHSSTLSLSLSLLSWETKTDCCCEAPEPTFFFPSSFFSPPPPPPSFGRSIAISVGRLKHNQLDCLCVCVSDLSIHRRGGRGRERKEFSSFPPLRGSIILRNYVLNCADNVLLISQLLYQTFFFTMELK